MDPVQVSTSSHMGLAVWIRPLSSHRSHGPVASVAPVTVVPSGPNVVALSRDSSHHGLGPYSSGPCGPFPYGQGPYGQGPYGSGPLGSGPYGLGPYGLDSYVLGPGQGRNPRVAGWIPGLGPWSQQGGLDSPPGFPSQSLGFSSPTVTSFPGSIPLGQGVGSAFGGVDMVWSRRPVAPGSVFSHPQLATGVGPGVSPSPVCSPVAHEVTSALTGGSLPLTAAVTSVSMDFSLVSSCSLSMAQASILSSPKPTTSMVMLDSVSAKRPAVSQSSGSILPAKRPRISDSEAQAEDVFNCWRPLRTNQKISSRMSRN